MRASLWTSRRSHIDASSPSDVDGVSSFVRFTFFAGQHGWPLCPREMETGLEFYGAIHQALADTKPATPEILASNHRAITGACSLLVAACTQAASPSAYVPQRFETLSSTSGVSGVWVDCEPANMQTRIATAISQDVYQIFVSQIDTVS